MITLTEAMEKDKVFVEWLNTLRSASYQRKAKTQVQRLLEFLSERYPEKRLASATDILKLRRQQDKSDNPKVKHWFADILPEYTEWQISKYGITVNSSLSNVTVLRGFFAYNRYPLRVRKGSMIKKEDVPADHKFTLVQLKRMLKYADAREKAILMCGKDLGMRVGDFARLERKLITSQVERAQAEKREITYPLQFSVSTRKTKTIAVCHLTKESVEALLTYWESEPESEYWFKNGEKGHISEAQLNYLLRNLWIKAYQDPEILKPPLGIGEKTTGRLRWHGLRDFLISALSNSGANTWIVKRLVGKKIGEDMRGYLDGVKLREAYSNVEPQITVSGLTNSNHLKIGGLEAKIDKQHTSIVSQEAEIDKLKTLLEAHKSKLERLEKALERHIETKEKHYGVDTVFAKEKED